MIPKIISLPLPPSDISTHLGGGFNYSSHSAGGSTHGGGMVFGGGRSMGSGHGMDYTTRSVASGGLWESMKRKYGGE